MNCTPVVPPESDGGGAVGAALQVIPAIAVTNVAGAVGADPVRLLLVLVVQHGLERNGRVHIKVMICMLINRDGVEVFVTDFKELLQVSNCPAALGSFRIIL